jgi:hypothetical protein
MGRWGNYQSGILARPALGLKKSAPMAAIKGTLRRSQIFRRRMEVWLQIGTQPSAEGVP